MTEPVVPSSGGTRGRGRPARLTRERIVAAALEIVGREGAGALSMRRVADALGSAPMSIYRHVRDKDELLTLLMDRVVAGLPRPDPPAEPRARLLALLAWQHDELGARPWIVDVLVKGDLMAPSILWLVEDIYAAWLDCGLTLPQAADANRIAWNFIIGDLVQRARSGRETGTDRGQDARQVSVPASAEPGAYPTLAALRPYWTAPDRRERFAGDLAILVNALVEGMGRDRDGRV